MTKGPVFMIKGLHAAGPCRALRVIGKDPVLSTQRRCSVQVNTLRGLKQSVCGIRGCRMQGYFWFIYTPVIYGRLQVLP